MPWAPGQATDMAARVIAERPQEMAGFLAREQERYAQIIKADNIRLE